MADSIKKSNNELMKIGDAIGGLFPSATVFMKIERECLFWTLNILVENEYDDIAIDVDIDPMGRFIVSICAIIQGDDILDINECDDANDCYGMILEILRNSNILESVKQ